ncbi:hypothetical protein MMC09_002286 [Bachmanniomyces sp. S44760]|nr:hypothetical protein [Bachmanniomyces sp. S44760]
MGSGDHDEGSYSRYQHFLARVYSLTCFLSAEICTNKRAEIDFDVRVYLLQAPNVPEHTHEHTKLIQGPLISMKALIDNSMRWDKIYTVVDQMLESWPKLYMDMIIGTHKNEFLNVGIPADGINHVRDEQYGNIQWHETHRSVAVGGTFDHLHAGHKLLLSATALVLDLSETASPEDIKCITVGITGDALLHDKKFANLMQSWDERQNAVLKFLIAILFLRDAEGAIQNIEHFSEDDPDGKANHYHLRSGLVVKCIEISDSYGPTITDKSISALVVSGETRSGGQAVNTKRIEKGWPRLEVFEVDVLDAQFDDSQSNSSQDFQNKISSTEIRKRLHKQISS